MSCIFVSEENKHWDKWVNSLSCVSKVLKASTDGLKDLNRDHVFDHGRYSLLTPFIFLSKDSLWEFKASLILKGIFFTPNQTFPKSQP